MQYINLQERKKRLRLIRFLFPFITALLFSVSFAPFHPFLRFFIFLAFIPFLWAVLHCKKRVFLTGFIFGFLSNAGVFWWISTLIVEDVSRILIASGVVILILYLSFYWGLVALLISKVKKISPTIAIFSFPFFWISFEFFRSLTSQLGFPWCSVGYSLSNIPSMIQIASITGISGLGFSILIFNSLIYWSITRKHRKRMILGLCFFICLFILQAASGNLIISTAKKGETVRVSLVQANILPEVKRGNEVDERLSILRSLTLDSAIRGSDLIVWSETSIPCYYRESSGCIKRIKNLVKEIGIPLVAGAPEYVGERKAKKRFIYNSAFLISDAGKTIGRYRKIYLVPFGEHLPFDNTFPVLRKIHFGQGDFSPGREFTVLSQGRFKFSVLICFESIFPRLVRKFVRNGAELLVNITEDSWFGKTSGPYQHAEMAIMRAVENRVSVARCGNTGISMLVDPYGRVLKTSKIFERIIIEGEIPLRRGTSFYTRFGDLFAWVIVAISILLFIFPLVAAPFKVRKSTLAG